MIDSNLSYENCKYFACETVNIFQYFRSALAPFNLIFHDLNLPFRSCRLTNLPAKRPIEIREIVASGIIVHYFPAS